MGKLKDLCLNWQEMYDCGIPMEYTIDKFGYPYYVIDLAKITVL